MRKSGSESIINICEALTKGTRKKKQVENLCLLATIWIFFSVAPSSKFQIFFLWHACAYKENCKSDWLSNASVFASSPCDCLRACLAQGFRAIKLLINALF